MKIVLTIGTLVVAIIITVLILLQGKGAGLGNAWGGGGEFFQTRRGIEKVTLQVTVGLIVLFLVFSVVRFFLK